eukprot:16429036-Heterocapsa_arctica.AAC.1
MVMARGLPDGPVPSKMLMFDFDCDFDFDVHKKILKPTMATGAGAAEPSAALSRPLTVADLQ